MMVRASSMENSGVGTTSAFSDPRMLVAPDDMSQPGSVSQDLFFDESPGTAALPPTPEPVYPTILSTHPTRPVVRLYRKSVNDKIVCLAILHHACHVLGRHAR